MTSRLAVVAVGAVLIAGAFPNGVRCQAQLRASPQEVELHEGRMTVTEIADAGATYRRLAARRAASRRLGTEHALREFHSFVDELLASERVAPRSAQNIHDTIAREARVVAMRGLANGACVVRLELVLAALRRAAPDAPRNLPW